MRIIVCVKQVPGSSQVEIDDATGHLKRDSAETRMNPFDLYALEAALQLKATHGGEIIAVTMGPDRAEAVIREAYLLGADNGYIFSDRKFAGADVLATAYTLAQGISATGPYDLIICGRQTTDGDTAQVGPAIAEYLDLPHLAWVSKIIEATAATITVEQNLTNIRQIAQMAFPCLITVEKDIYYPRLPSYRRKIAIAGKAVHKLNFYDFADQDETKYGLKGSATRVERTYQPTVKNDQIFLTGSSTEQCRALLDVLRGKRYLQENG
jgi:electron transfer flavoprotein beta subunit